MRNFILLFVAALFVGCVSSGVQVTFDDEKSNAIRAHIQNYCNNDVEAVLALAADNVEVYINSSEPISLEDVLSIVEVQHATFGPITTSWSQDDGGEDIGAWIESTNYPEGPANEAVSVTQAWFTWNGTSKLSGEVISVPVHVVYVWNSEGKIETEYQFYDPTNIAAAVEASLAASE